MSTPRQRMLDAFRFNRPERIPVFYHRSPAGLYVHGEKLLRLFNRYPPDNPMRFERIPVPPPGTVVDGRYRELVTDEWGTTWENCIFGLQGSPVKFPLADWQADDYVFPPRPSDDPTAFGRDKGQVAAQRRDHLTFGGWVLLFEKLCELRPMDQVLMDLSAGDAGLVAFLDRLVDYWRGVIADLIEIGYDVIFFGDDWGGQTAPLVSPGLFRKIFRPRYAELLEQIRSAGRMILFHSCGVLGPIWDELFDLGVNGIWPQAALFEADPGLRRRCEDRHVTVFVHPDRQRLIPRGTPREIETAIRRYAEHYRRLGGGGIFYVEIENDAPFENARALIEAVDRCR